MKNSRIGLRFSRLFSPLIRWSLGLSVALFLVACGGGGGDSAVATVFNENRVAAENTFTATLTGSQEVPPNLSAALGAGTVIVDENTRTLRATLTAAGLAGTAAHIDEAPPGVSGPIVFPLTETSPGSGIWTLQATLTDAQLNSLRAGNYYFNVQSVAIPTGEIRGQILPRLSTPRDIGVDGAGTTAAGTQVATVFKNPLTGSQEVPLVATGAKAVGTASIDHIAKTLTVAINTLGVTGTEAHVHEGLPGQNGPVVFSLAQTFSGSGIWFAKVGLNDAQLNAILSGNTYLDVHSVAFPNGEVRGQVAQLHRRSRLPDCRFGGFGFDDCTVEGAGLFIGLGIGGFGVSDFGVDNFGVNDFREAGPGFDGFGTGSIDSGSIDTGNVGFDGGGASADTPAPGIIF